MRRLANWDVALGHYFADTRRLAHRYGKADCALYAAGAILAMTGEDFARWHRSKYTTEAGAARYMRRQGWQDLAALGDAFLPRIDLAKAGRGDLLLMPGDAGEFFAIKAGARAVALGERGPELFAIDPNSLAWKVG